MDRGVVDGPRGVVDGPVVWNRDALEWMGPWCSGCGVVDGPVV